MEIYVALIDKPIFMLSHEKVPGRNLQNFLGKFVRFFVTLGLEILILLWLKVVFEADINKKLC